MARIGSVVRRISNVYWVRVDDVEYACQTRARLKKEQADVRIGDRVRIAEIDEVNRRGVVVEVLPRRATLSRPPIANVDQVLVVFAASQPEFSPLLLDRFLVLAAISEIPAVVVINKSDLVSPEELERITRPYRDIGYRVVTTSAVAGEVNDLLAILPGKVSVFAGPSGVGKSSLLNCLDPRLSLRSAEVSQRLGRGRHTTTYAALYPVAGGLVADTPGYSHLEFPPLAPEQLGWLYPEMAPHIADCRLSDCLHDSEPGCAVKERAKIWPSRYESYLHFLQELVCMRREALARSRKVESAVKTTGGPIAGKRLVRIDADRREDSRRVVKQRLAELASLGSEGTVDDEGLEEYEG